MRIAHLADLHLTERPCRSDVPLEEQEEILGRIAGRVNESAVDLSLIAGDCHDGESTPKSRLALVTFLRRLKGPKVIIYGNHDRDLDLDLLDSCGAHVCSRPEAFPSYGFGYDLAVAPWPRVRNAEGYAAIVRGLRAQCGEKAILLAHCDALDAKLDGGQETTGKVDASISMHDLGEMGWSYAALGHYHARQLFPWGGFGGGIRPMRHGDDSRKGVVIVDLETKKREEIDCAGYRLLTIDFQPLELRKSFIMPVDVKTKDRIRIRYQIDEERQAAAYDEARRLACDYSGKCRSVSIEPEVIPTVRVRAPEIAAAKTDEDVLRAYLATTGSTRVEEVCAKAEVLK